MHTKLSILIIIFMVLIPTTIIAISSGKRTVVKVANASESKTEYHSAGKTFPFEKEWHGPFTKAAIQKPSNIPLEEDGNHHYFHFRRLRRSRYREIFKLAGKILLLIIHFSLLVGSYLHCLH
jgi:hypothetical protein